MDESGHKIRKTWVDQGSKFYNRSMKSWFHGNDIGIYLTLKEGKCFVAQGFTRTLKTKIYKNMTAVLKMCTLRGQMKQLTNTIKHTMDKKTKAADVQPGTYIDYGVGCNNKVPRFNVCDHVRISKYKNIFPKGYTPN